MNKYISSIWDYGYVSKNDNNHNIYRWLGKLPPEMVSNLLDIYSDQGDTILANFSGSGTVALECKLKNRNCIGIDSNPLSVLLSKTKVTPSKFNLDEFLIHLNKTKVGKEIIMGDFEKKWFKKFPLDFGKSG